MSDALTLTSILVFLVGLAFAELKDWLPWLARKVVLHAARRLSPEMHERMEEEWLAELEQIPGKLSPLFFALMLCRAAEKMRQDATPISSEERLTRTFDATFAIAVLTSLSPLLLILWLLVRRQSDGRVLVGRSAYGQGGKAVRLYAFALPVDTTGRLTPLGRFLYRTELHMLPRFINVANGSLALFGPRPQWPVANNDHTGADTLSVRPGLVPFEADGVRLCTGSSLRERCIGLWRVAWRGWNKPL
ncbi:sugar transferase [Cupriavidus basilensis]|uniref:sugar transferase n=1 Tax=Cupriavidus basilensis TaxID=68895 RepID=UPI00075077D5|nr:sugar transferase [Cupriavidus basilensis]